MLLDAPGSTVEKLSEEHAVVVIGPEDVLELGQRVLILPNHACVVANLADALVGIESGREPRTVRVDARGRSC